MTNITKTIAEMIQNEMVLKPEEIQEINDWVEEFGGVFEEIGNMFMPDNKEQPVEDHAEGTPRPLKHMKLCIGKDDIANIIGVNEEQFAIADVKHIHEGNESTEFIVILDSTVDVDTNYEVAAMSKEIGNLRRQRLIDGVFKTSQGTYATVAAQENTALFVEKIVEYFDSVLDYAILESPDFKALLEQSKKTFNLDDEMAERLVTSLVEKVTEDLDWEDEDNVLTAAQGETAQEFAGNIGTYIKEAMQKIINQDEDKEFKFKSEEEFKDKVLDIIEEVLKSVVEDTEDGIKNNQGLVVKDIDVNNLEFLSGEIIAYDKNKEEVMTISKNGTLTIKAGTIISNSLLSNKINCDSKQCKKDGCSNSVNLHQEKLPSIVEILEVKLEEISNKKDILLDGFNKNSYTWSERRIAVTELEKLDYEIKSLKVVTKLFKEDSQVDE